MKIKMMTLAAVFCCALSSTMFTACGSDDDDENENKVLVDNTKPVGAQMDYHLVVSEETLTAFDLSVEYYDENCQLQTEKLTQEEWTKAVKTTKLPASLGYRLKAKLKEGYDANYFQKHSVLYGFSYYGSTVNAAGEKADLKVDSSFGRGARWHLREKEFSLFLSQEDDVLISIKGDFDASGAATEECWYTGRLLSSGS